MEGHDKNVDEVQHGDHSVNNEFPVDEVEHAPEDSSQVCCLREAQVSSHVIL